MPLHPHPHTIGVFDSGIGGVSVAAAVAKRLPGVSMIYVADNARAPYGPRSAGEIRAFSREITRSLLAAGAGMIVVACNTATAWAIDALRAEFPGVPFVGMEPALKPAAAGGKIGVLATRATLDSARYRELRAKYLSAHAVWEDDCRGLVPLIEVERPGSGALRRHLRGIIDPLVAEGVDTLVLGCTHYPMVKEDIAAVAGPGVTVLDPAPAAARQVERLLGGADVRVGERGAHHFYGTGTGEALERSLQRLPALNAGRKWLVPYAALTV